MLCGKVFWVLFEICKYGYASSLCVFVLDVSTPSVCHDMSPVTAAGHNGGCASPLGSFTVLPLVCHSNDELIIDTRRMSEKDPNKPNKTVPPSRLATPEPPFVVEPGDQTCKSCTGIMYLSKYVSPLASCLLLCILS